MRSISLIRRGSVTVVVIVGVVATALGLAALMAHAWNQPSHQPVPGHPTPDWDHPMGPLGFSVPQGHNPREYLTFVPVHARNLENARSTFVTDPARAQPIDRAVVWVYDDPNYGR